MTHTLESLKKILDEGGTIIKGRRKFCKKDGQYHFDSGFGNSGPCSTLFLEYALSKGEWSELKAEPTDEEKRLMLQGLAMRQDRMRGIPKEAAYTPSTITVPIDQWNALNKELGELKAKVRAEEWYKLKAEGFPLKSALEEIKFGFDGPSVGSVSHGQTLDPAAEYAKPYTFLPIPAAEIMVGIKAGQTWSNGYYTSSGCNEIGIYFDHKFGTTTVPWELVAGFIEDNKIWEKK